MLDDRLSYLLIDWVRRLAADAGTTDYESAAFELVHDDDGWRWQFIDEDERLIATGTDPHDSRDAVVDELERVKADVGSASIFGIGTAAFELHETDEGWGWRLVDGNSDVIGRSITTYRDRGEALSGMQSVKESAPDAQTVIVEDGPSGP